MWTARKGGDTNFITDAMIFYMAKNIILVKMVKNMRDFRRAALQFLLLHFKYFSLTLF